MNGKEPINLMLELVAKIFKDVEELNNEYDGIGAIRLILAL